MRKLRYHYTFAYWGRSFSSMQPAFRTAVAAVLIMGFLLGSNRAGSQIYSFTTASNGNYNAIASNMTATGLSRGSGLDNPSCGGFNDGYGADAWPTGGVNIASANSNGDYIQFTITPNSGYYFNITGFTASLRRDDPSGTSNDGPTDVRYAYSIDNGATFTSNGAALTPNNSSSCSNAGTARAWASFAAINTAAAVIFRIYGFNSGGNSGDLYLRNLTVSGSVAVIPSLFYRSKASGNWNVAATWESSADGNTWGNAFSTPTSADKTITIRNGHTVAVTADVSVDEVTVNSGGQISVNSGQTLTVADGAGTDLTVNGTLSNAGTITPTGTLAFGSGGAYSHNRNGGTIPTASWNANSTCTIAGMTDAYPGGAGQTFGNVVFSSALSGNIEMTSNLTCAGNLTMSNSGSALRLTNFLTSRTISVAGNFSQTGGTFTVVSGFVTGTLNVAGNFSISGGTFLLKEDFGTATLNVTGNFSQTGGTFNFNSSIFGGTGALRVGGNFSQSNGTLTETNNGNGAVVFNGGAQTLAKSGGTLSGTINFTVNSGSTVSVGGANLGGSNGIFTINNGGTLKGTGPLTVPTGGALTNNGTIAPGNSVGTLTITGSLTSSGTLSMEIASLTSFDQISVSGTATINGTLAVDFGTYTPTVGNTFALITAGSFAGTPTVSITPNTITGTYANGVLTVNAVLPITLLSFTGQALERTVELSWRTASELNNDYMAVERSPDGRAFDEIGRVAGRGTTYETQSYAFVDQSPLPGLNYYRLRQVDFDGATEYHPVISVVFKGESRAELRLYPNPVREELHLVWNTPATEAQGETVLHILNASGQIVARHVLAGGAGVYNLPVEQLPAGVYVAQWTQGGRVKTERFVKE